MFFNQNIIYLNRHIQIFSDFGYNKNPHDGGSELNY